MAKNLREITKRKSNKNIKMIDLINPMPPGKN